MNIELHLEIARDQAEKKAWEALSKYKFWMFGYWAAKWVSCNQMLPISKANPFRDLVKMAKDRRD